MPCSVFTLCVTALSPQVRIEQVIVAEPGAVLLYKLSNLLKFYHHTVRYLRSQIEFAVKELGRDLRAEKIIQ